MAKNNLKTLTAVLDDLHAQGFTTDFRYEKNRLIPLQYPSRQYMPDDIEVLDSYRFEGDTDPADASILYVFRTSDGLQGTLTNGYGPSADLSVDEFFKRAGEPTFNQEN